MAKSKILKSVESTAQGLNKIGVLDTVTMREIESLCLEPANELMADDIKEIRKKEKVSQPVFAKFLNVSPSTVKQWELGVKHPSGSSLRLLNIIKKNGLKILLS